MIHRYLIPEAENSPIKFCSVLAACRIWGRFPRRGTGLAIVPGAVSGNRGHWRDGRRPTMSVLDRVLRKTQEAQIPFWMHLDLTYRCHQRCLHCYIPEAWRRGEGPGPELPPPGQGHPGPTGCGRHLFPGSERRGSLPALRPQGHPGTCPPAELLPSSLMTSGTLGVTRDTLRFLAELGLNGLLMTLFSLDPAVHDYLTGIPGSWARLWTTIREAKAAGVPVVLNCIAMRPNASQVEAVRDFAAGEGIPLRLDANVTAPLGRRPPPVRAWPWTRRNSKISTERWGWAGIPGHSGNGPPPPGTWTPRGAGRGEQWAIHPLRGTVALH